CTTSSANSRSVGWPGCASSFGCVNDLLLELRKPAHVISLNNYDRPNMHFVTSVRTINRPFAVGHKIFRRRSAWRAKLFSNFGSSQAVLFMRSPCRLSWFGHEAFQVI